MKSYNFTKQRKKIYQLYAEDKNFADIAKAAKISVFKVSQIIKRIEEKVPKAELEKIKASAAKHKVNII